MTKWNLLTVDAAKGLEFGNVIVISSNMTNNRKYVAFTRAMNALYVYNGDGRRLKPIRESAMVQLVKKREFTVFKEDEKVSISYSNMEKRNSVADFFKNEGCVIKDDLANGGYLWVIGERREIEHIINEAVQIYDIDGIYTTAPAIGNKAGWCTRARTVKKGKRL